MYGTTTHTTFAGVTVRREVKTHCRKCGKKLKRVLRDTYFRNGMHNETATHAQYVAAQKELAEKMEKDGILCFKCDAPPLES